MKVCRATELPEYTYINIKATNDAKSIGKVDQNHLKYISWTLWTLSCRFRPNLPIFAIFGSEIKVRMSSEVPECTKIDKKATRDIESTTKVHQNYSKYISWILSCWFWPNILILAFSGPRMKVPSPKKPEIAGKTQCWYFLHQIIGARIDF